MSPHSVVISGARAPAALHAVRAVAAAGYRVVAADSVRWPLARFSRAAGAWERLASPVHEPLDFASDVARILETHRPQRWIPTCEEVFHLAALAQQQPVLSDVLWAPPLDTLLAAHDKYAFAQRARALDGADVGTRLLTGEADVHAVRSEARQLVFKPVFSRFATDVHVRPFADQLERIHPSPKRPWVAQSYLPGEELCAYATAHAGQLTGLSVYRGRYRCGRGASTFFEPVSNARITAFVEAYVAATAWSGQVAFDFRRDSSGVPVAIECNPRATSGLHAWAASAALGRTLLTDAPAPKPLAGPAMVGAGVLASAWSGEGLFCRPRRWLGDLAGAREVVWAREDMGPALAQPLALLEIATRAAIGRRSFQAASTVDLAWDGDPWR